MTINPVLKYFDQFHEGDTSVPVGNTLMPIAKHLDRATNKALKSLMTVLESSKEHRSRVSLLKKQTRTAGKFSNEKILFKGENAFEQMVAINDWLLKTQIQKIHTFYISGRSNGYVPVRVNKFPTDTTMMHVVLGNTRGDHKAPKYTDWAQSDPWLTRSQRIFIHPLEALEIVRQPHYSAATVLKGNAFEEKSIETEWRYGEKFACVESKGQSKDSSKKKQSSALNACSMTDYFSDIADPQALESDIAIYPNYEHYADEGYADDLDLSVSPGSLIIAAEKAVIKKDSSDLERLMEILTIAKLRPPQTPQLKRHIGDRLKVLDKDYNL